MSSLIAVYDPSGKLGLTDMSPGGGTMPITWTCLGCRRLVVCGEVCCMQQDRHHVDALLLVTEDGTPDPIGMARAREVLARAMKLRPEGGVTFVSGLGPNSDDFKCEYHWTLAVDLGFAREKRTWEQLPNESAPEALARLLAEHAGCEVIRG